MKVSEQLNLAADLIQTRGWVWGVNGWNTDGTGPLCLEGAIAAATGISMDASAHSRDRFFSNCPAYRAVDQYLDDDLQGEREPWEWNDDQPNGTRVIEVLRAAAAIEAAREEALVTADT